LCKRCDARRAQAACLADAWDAAALPVPNPAHGSDLPGLDTREALEGLARRLEQAHEADRSDASVARELRMTLVALRGLDGAGDDDRSRFWAEFSGA